MLTLPQSWLYSHFSFSLTHWHSHTEQWSVGICYLIYNSAQTLGFELSSLLCYMWNFSFLAIYCRFQIVDVKSLIWKNQQCAIQWAFTCWHSALCSIKCIGCIWNDGVSYELNLSDSTVQIDGPSHYHYHIIYCIVGHIGLCYGEILSSGVLQSGGWEQLFSLTLCHFSETNPQLEWMAWCCLHQIKYYLSDYITFMSSKIVSWPSNKRFTIIIPTRSNLCLINGCSDWISVVKRRRS